MERPEQAMVERVINHEMQERFDAGAVQRAVLLARHGTPARASCSRCSSAVSQAVGQGRR
jgi:hypothetical protein